MTTRVAINGFGRIGRLVVRALESHSDLELVQVNDPFGGVGCAAHLLEFDTVHGRFDADISHDESAIILNGKRIAFTEGMNPAEADVSANEVDLVLETSGVFKTPAKLRPFFDSGAKKVVVGAPVKEGGVPNIVVGCNDEAYRPEEHNIVTAASCTTNCLAPVVKVLHDKVGIERGVITTIHDVTNTQVIVDAPHKDLRRARSALNSLIPTTTGSATAIALIYPDLKGKLDGTAVRVPLLNASITDCVFTVKEDVTVEQVNGWFKEAAEGSLQGVLGYEDRPLVSADYVDDPRSGIVDGPETKVVDGRMVKVIAWYDNEWGYTCRLAELAERVARDL